jgi:hypothetical protein
MRGVGMLEAAYSFASGPYFIPVMIGLGVAVCVLAVIFRRPKG